MNTGTGGAILPKSQSGGVWFMPTLEHQKRRFLNEPRRNFEVGVSLAGFWWFVAMSNGWRQGIDPLAWMFGDVMFHSILIALVGFASLAHSFGIRGNGRWGIYSTGLRLVAMLVIAGAALVITYGAFLKGNSAFGAYPIFFVACLRGIAGAWGDCRMAWEGVRYA